MTGNSSTIRLTDALETLEVKEVVDRVRSAPNRTLREVLELAGALAQVRGSPEVAGRLSAELSGYDDAPEADLPEERRVHAFASPFPVRALDLGLLDAEEVFLVNREKFSQVTLSIGQPVAELEEALAQLGSGGVLSLRVPASRINERSADADDSDVYIYILPRELRRILDSVRDLVLQTLVDGIVGASSDSRSSG